MFEIFDGRHSLVIAFDSPALLDKTPLVTKAGKLYPEMAVAYLGGKNTSAFFSCGGIAFDPPLIYQGAVHTFRTDGILACFTQGAMKEFKPWVEWYWALHWIPANQEFMTTSSKSLSGRVYQTEKAIFNKIGKGVKHNEQLVYTTIQKEAEA